MALSKPDAPKTVSDLPVVAQHYLMCGTEDCKRNCQFYCNDCHRPMCEQCRDEHIKSSDTKNHEVVQYRQRKIQLPVEKCKDHPTKNIDMFCQDCQIPVCSKCVIQGHQKHIFKDLEAIYSDAFTICLDNIHKIHQYFIPSTQDMQRDIKENTRDVQEIVDKIRRSMKTEAESFKSLVDTVTSDNIEQVNKMEESLTKELQSQDKTYQDYISYLEGLVKDFGGYLSSTELHNNPLIISLSGKLTIKPISEPTKPVPPVFTAGQYSKDDVTKLLGRVTFPDTKPENREIKPMKTATTKYNVNNSSFYLFVILLLFFSFITLLLLENIDNRIGKVMKQDTEKSDVKQTLSLSPSVTKVREYTFPAIENIWHMSLGKPGRLWVSDWGDSIIQTDLQGNQLQKLKSSGKYGYHTVTQDGDLIYKDKKNKVINMRKQDNIITDFIKTGDWKPLSIHSSHINGDILVGMIKEDDAKVTRYSKEGEEIQTIQRDNNGQRLYSNPHDITENINGDICTSDYNKRAVVVVDKSGQHRFSYTGQGLWISPCDICTDILGNILVCDENSNTVHLLDQDGQFLSIDLLHTVHQGKSFISSICVDDENNLHVQQNYSNAVTVFKYLQ